MVSADGRDEGRSRGKILKMTDEAHSKPDSLFRDSNRYLPNMSQAMPLLGKVRKNQNHLLHVVSLCVCLYTVFRECRPVNYWVR